MLTQELLKSSLSYCPESGLFVWKIKYGRAHPGKIAGSVRKDGYVSIKIDGKQYKAHRLAWLYVNGVWPRARIDHRDNCQSNNRWDNIRLATHSENMFNRKLNKNNAAGYKGVVLKKGRYIAYINKHGARHWLGGFDTAAAAAEARAEKARELHGEFARDS